MAELEIRPYRPSDCTACAGLKPWSWCGREQMDAVWRWRFGDTPAAGRYVACATEGDSVLATVGLSPIRVWLQGAVRAGALLSAAATNEPARRQGHARKLLDYLVEDLAPRVDAFAVFPPPELLAPLVEHHGFSVVRDLPTLRLDGTLFRKLPPPDPKTVKPAGSFDARFDTLWARVRRSLEAAVVRDRRALAWRFEEHPSRRYRVHTFGRSDGVLGAYSVVCTHPLRGTNVLRIVDLLADSAEAAEQVVLAAIADAAQSRSAAVETLLALDHPYRLLLQRMGFQPDGPVYSFAARGGTGEEAPRRVHALSWHVTMGDFESF